MSSSEPICALPRATDPLPFNLERDEAPDQGRPTLPLVNGRLSPPPRRPTGNLARCFERRSLHQVQKFASDVTARGAGTCGLIRGKHDNRINDDGHSSSTVGPARKVAVQRHIVKRADPRRPHRTWCHPDQSCQRAVGFFAQVAVAAHGVMPQRQRSAVNDHAASARGRCRFGERLGIAHGREPRALIECRHLLGPCWQALGSVPSRRFVT